jgi:hypothetical protein
VPLHERGHASPLLLGLADQFPPDPPQQIEVLIGAMAVGQSGVLHPCLQKVRLPNAESVVVVQ